MLTGYGGDFSPPNPYHGERMNRLRQRRAVPEEVVKKTSTKPDDTMTVGEIKKWLDDNGVEYTGSHNTKAKLLALIEE